jgi:hypothetical protein
MGIQCLSFNSLLLVGVVVLKMVSSLACLKHHFDGVISWFVNQDSEDRAIFWLISYLFVFSTLYCYFGFIVGNPTLFQFFDSLCPILICLKKNNNNQGRE